MHDSELVTFVTEFLAKRPGKACFVADLSAPAAGGAPPDREALEAVLGELASAGVVVLQHNYCPDPHFSDEDLRVVALIDHAQPAGDQAAFASAQRLWERWLQTFLASHRCT